jgi:hypothetical protein
MAVVGSFALLLVLVCGVYCVVAGIVAAASKKDFAPHLAETARRAGIATFALVLLAAVILVVVSLEDEAAAILAGIARLKESSPRTVQSRGV